jgi:hypothetical protein
MKRFGWILVMLMAASPAWAAKKITVGELEDMLRSMQQEKKSDLDVATQLRQVELTQELTRAVMNSLVSYVPGPYSTEQIYVLEARSAVLAPPAADLPATPAPDAATQKAMLDKAVDYTTKTYAQLPHLTATKTTLRFQDNMEVVKASSGMHSSATYSVDPSLAAVSQYIHYINSTETPVESVNGAEKLPSAKDKTPWGQNGMIVLLGQGPVLSTVLQEAQAAGTINWLRWELVNGREAAVYSFTVDKKKSHYAVNYCCFPDWEQTGRMSYPAPTQGGLGDYTPRGNMQTNTTFNPYKATVPYHGEIFVDPNSGIVVRLITIADFKATDVVHQEDQRIDYGPATVGGKALELPIKTIVNTEIVPNADTGAGKYITRHTLFTSEYNHYQLAAQ